jgi:hypothetical protein
VFFFENRALRSIFGSKTNEVTGQWRKLRGEELRYVYFSPNIVRMIKSIRMKWPVLVTRMGERTDVYKVWWRNLRGKSSLGRPKRRWEDNIKTDLQEVEVWTGSIWLRVWTGGGHL